jgi:hypothetical protein
LKAREAEKIEKKFLEGRACLMQIVFTSTKTPPSEVLAISRDCSQTQTPSVETLGLANAAPDKA